MNLAIIQARLTSRRLPHKVLLELPKNSRVMVLERVINRVKKAKAVDKICLAVAHDSYRLDEFAYKTDIYFHWYPSNERNCLAEFLSIVKGNRCLSKLEAQDLIIRITADCPCVDPVLIDEVVRQYEPDLTCSHNDNEGTLQGDGLDVEVFSCGSFMRAAEYADKPEHFEHVTKVFYDRQDVFKVNYAKGLKLPEMKLSLDTEEDYERINEIYERLGADFSYKDI